MKVKVTIEVGVAIQNIELVVPDILLKDAKEEEKLVLITSFVNGWLSKEIKVSWEELV